MTADLNWQYIVVIAIVIIAAVLLLRMFIRTAREEDTPLNECHGCKLSGVCHKQQHHKSDEKCDDKVAQ